ncbi:MAG: hypothetical protein ACKO1O_05400 [Erythrobacter sp.]
MSEGLTIVAAVVAGFMLIVGIVRVSIWMTSRTPASEFKKQRRDATGIHEVGTFPDD